LDFCFWLVLLSLARLPYRLAILPMSTFGNFPYLFMRLKLTIWTIYSLGIILTSQSQRSLILFIFEKNYKKLNNLWNLNLDWKTIISIIMATNGETLLLLSVLTATPLFFDGVLQYQILLQFHNFPMKSLLKMIQKHFAMMQYGLEHRWLLW